MYVFNIGFPTSPSRSRTEKFDNIYHRDVGSNRDTTDVMTCTNFLKNKIFAQPIFLSESFVQTNWAKKTTTTKMKKTLKR